MRDDQPQLGAQELALVRFIAEHQPIAAREVAKEFGEPAGLARTTVVTMLERLRKKRFLQRSKKVGIFVYKLASEENDVLHGVVESFVERTLGGSIAPFVAYLTRSNKLQPDELEALKRLVDEMQPGGRDDAE